MNNFSKTLKAKYFITNFWLYNFYTVYSRRVSSLPVQEKKDFKGASEAQAFPYHFQLSRHNSQSGPSPKLMQIFNIGVSLPHIICASLGFSLLMKTFYGTTSPPVFSSHPFHSQTPKATHARIPLPWKFVIGKSLATHEHQGLSGI